MDTVVRMEIEKYIDQVIGHVDTRFNLLEKSMSTFQKQSAEHYRLDREQKEACNDHREVIVRECDVKIDSIKDMVSTLRTEFAVVKSVVDKSTGLRGNITSALISFGIVTIGGVIIWALSQMKA